MLATPNERCPFSVATTAQTFWELYHRLQRGEPFVYSRFGDGDFEIMLGGGDSFHLPSKELGQELWELYHDTSEHNLVASAMHQIEDGMAPGLFAPWSNPRYAVFRQPRRYENAIALHYAAVFKPHILRMMFDLVADRPKLFLGPKVPHVERLIGTHDHVEVPAFNAYATIDQWYPELARAIEQHREVTRSAPLVMTAAGMATRAAHRRLLRDHMPVQALDLGSLVDFAAGEATRTWIKIAPPGAREVLLGVAKK